MRRRPMRDDARTLFAGILGDADLTALLLDTRGAHLAGSYLDADGREIGGEIGAALSGIGAEVSRALDTLQRRPDLACPRSCASRPSAASCASPDAEKSFSSRCSSPPPISAASVSTCLPLCEAPRESERRRTVGGRAVQAAPRR